MAKTLEVLRVDLARGVGRYFMGTADSGTTTTLVDTELKKWTADDALIGAYVLITSAGSAAPEGESRRITDYVAASGTITVDPAFTAAVGATDVYEVYLSPLTLDQWNQCINQAIDAAWPDLWEIRREIYQDMTRWPVYVQDPDVQEVVELWAFPFTSVKFADLSPDGATQWLEHPDGFSPQRIPNQLWRQEGTPGTDLAVNLLRYFPPGGLTLHIYYKVKYPALAATEGSELDSIYILEAARANWYQMMADASRVQSDQASYLQLMNHYQEKAAERKKALAAALLGMPPVERKEKK